MRPIMMGLSVVWLVMSCSGCASLQPTEPVFPQDQVPAVTHSSQFDKVVGGMAGYEGRAMKLAGRIVEIDAQDKGYMILAKWLPYPAHMDIDEGPPHSSSNQHRHFAVLFGRTVKDDPFEMWKGNKFILEGDIAGTKKMLVNVFGEERSLLYVRATCVHVWETGENGAASDPDAQWAGTMARTFCVGKSK